MYMKKIIGFSGKAGSGKDFAATQLKKILVDKGMTVDKFAFAGPLKDMLTIVIKPFGVSVNEKTKEIFPGVTVRQALQSLGNEWGRDTIHQNLWVELLKKKVENSKSDCVLITDVRYPNETQILKDLGAKIIYMKRDIKEIEQNTHPSEISMNLDDCDFFVDNNKTKKELGEELWKIFNDL